MSPAKNSLLTMLIDSLQELLFTLRKNKLRTALTAFGVFWGILMLILLLGAGQGLANGANSNFGNDDRSSIWISSRTTAIPYKGLAHGRKITFTEDDIDAIVREIGNIQYISAENRAGERWNRSVNVSHKNKTGSFEVFGVADDFFNIKKYLDYPSGRTLNKLDNIERRKIALIGTRVSDRLFEEGVDPVGKLINFHNVILQVIGVFYDDGRNGQMSERVYIPLATFQKVYGRGNDIGQILLTPKPGIDGIQLENDVISLLKLRHQIAPNDRRAIHTYNYAKQLQGMTELFRAIDAFIWFVGLGTLTAGIVGISNIMIITIKDRTREIGIRKALGATPATIVCMVLFETIFLTTIAGYAGLVVGISMLEGANNLLAKFGDQLSYFNNPEVDLNTAVTALILLIGSGALAGLVPAIRAASILPIEAMREE